MVPKDIVIIKDIPDKNKRGGKFNKIPEPDPGEGLIVQPASVDRLPEEIKEKIRVWYIEDKPFKEMAQDLRLMGYDVHYTLLWKWCKRQFRDTSVSAETALMQDELRLGIERKAIYSALDVAIDTIKRINITPIVKDMRDFDHLCSAISKLTSAAATRDRVEIEKDAAVKKVQETMKAEVRRLLGGDPELISKVHAYIDQGTENILDNV